MGLGHPRRNRGAGSDGGRHRRPRMRIRDWAARVCGFVGVTVRVADSDGIKATKSCLLVQDAILFLLQGADGDILFSHRGRSRRQLRGEKQLAGNYVESE